MLKAAKRKGQAQQSGEEKALQLVSGSTTAWNDYVVMPGAGIVAVRIKTGGTISWRDVGGSASRNLAAQHAPERVHLGEHGLGRSALRASPNSRRSMTGINPQTGASCVHTPSDGVARSNR